MKKEVSDHLARAFFDKGIRKKRDFNFFFFLVLSVLVVGVLVLTVSTLGSSKVRSLETSGVRWRLEKHDGPYVLNFDFTQVPSKIQSLEVDLPQVDLSGYNRLSFSVRLFNAREKELGALKVTLMNRRKESSHIYLSDITPSWQSHKLSLSQFGKIQDWSNLTQLVFSLEEWNLNPKKGQILIDAIEFSKN
ncbi:MAG: hypothetical protein V1863_04855 [Candidatus Omnitrophota bacterium]